MKEFVYRVNDKSGIHARPAGLLVKEACKYHSSIIIILNEKTADAKRLFSVMGLSAKYGDELKVTVEGSDEAEAAASLETFLKNNM